MESREHLVRSNHNRRRTCMQDVANSPCLLSCVNCPTNVHIFFLFLRQNRSRYKAPNFVCANPWPRAWILFLVKEKSSSNRAPIELQSIGAFINERKRRESRTSRLRRVFRNDRFRSSFITNSECITPWQEFFDAACNKKRNKRRERERENEIWFRACN